MRAKARLLGNDGWVGGEEVEAEHITLRILWQGGEVRTAARRGGATEDAERGKGQIRPHAEELAPVKALGKFMLETLRKTCWRRLTSKLGILSLNTDTF